MKRVFKYPIPIIDQPQILLPIGAKVLHVGEQHDDMMLWALVDDAETRWEPREFRVLGTGHSFNGDDFYSVYIGTVIMQRGALVFHVFMKP